VYARGDNKTLRLSWAHIYFLAAALIHHRSTCVELQQCGVISRAQPTPRDAPRLVWCRTTLPCFAKRAWM